MVESFDLVSMMPKRGLKSCFATEGKVALMFLKMKMQRSFPKIMEELNGNIHSQMLCDILIEPTHPLTNYKLMDDIAAQLESSNSSRTAFSKESSRMTEEKQRKIRDMRPGPNAKNAKNRRV